MPVMNTLSLQMLPLYEEPWFTFRFAETRIIPRFRLEGVEASRRVSVFMINTQTGERLSLLATASVGEAGWVDLDEPITVRAGEAFVAVPGQSSATPPLTLLGVAGRFAVCKLPPGSTCSSRRQSSRRQLRPCGEPVISSRVLQT